jgi:NAD(P)H-hydrate epimerase
MCHGIGNDANLPALLERADAIGIGPGLGTDGWAQAALQTAMSTGLPLVVDADALNLLAPGTERRDDWILTPHPGEAARLLDCPTSDIQSDRRRAITALRKNRGGTIVLKGAGTLVSSATGTPWLCSAGNPGMAAPGMGDVLTGIIGGLLVQGLQQELAAVTGVAVHAAAGDLAARRGQRGLMATDLLQELKSCVNP